MSKLKTDKLNEENVKIKIVLRWLKEERGFKEEDLSFEESFEIKFGRSNKTIKSRYDILVTDELTKKHLFIVELKREGLKLENDVRDQGISYARHTNPITPFVITTDGKDCKLYETITAKEIKDKTLIDGYEISLNTVDYYEDLKNFIGLNENNFKQFFKNEYKINSSQLIAKSIEEEKFYYPPLFEPHPDLENHFNDFIKSDKRAFSVIAPSGMGKTCWMCFKANMLIEENNFVFFLRFADIRNGIFETIVNDLNWNPNFTRIYSAQDGFNKFNKLIGEKPVYIFIDGLDEGSQTDKGKIFEEFFNYAKNNYRLIVSCKSYYWSDFKKYHSAPSRIFENLYKFKSHNEIEDHHYKEINAFLLDKLSDSQLKKMIKKYKTHYSYTKHISQKLIDEFKKNPYLLRIAFSILLNNKDYVIDLTSRDLIENYFDSIKKRFQSNTEKIGDREIQAILKIAKLIFEKNKDRISNRIIINEIGKIPEILFKSNILIKTEKDAFTSDIEFYFSKLRDFIIAFKIEDFDNKDENYFNEYKKDLTNVRFEVLTTYFSISGIKKQQQICKKAYIKANNFLNKRIEIVNKKYSNFKEAIEPFTAGSLAIVTNVDLEDERCATYSFKKINSGEGPVILETSSSADLFQAAINKYDIKTMHYCYDLNEEFLERDLTKEIYEIIELNKNRDYVRSFNISHNKYILIERLLVLVLKNYKTIYGEKITQFHPSSSYLPLNLSKLEEKILNNNSSKETNLILSYIQALKELEVLEITSPILPDWGKTKLPRKFSFENYNKKDLKGLIKKLYLIFLQEYKIFIDINFPTLKSDFSFYNSLNCKTVLIVDPDTLRLTKIVTKSQKIEVICLIEKIPPKDNIIWKYSYENISKSSSIIEYIMCKKT